MKRSERREAQEFHLVGIRTGARRGEGNRSSKCEEVMVRGSLRCSRGPILSCRRTMGLPLHVRDTEASIASTWLLSASDRYYRRRKTVTGRSEFLKVTTSFRMSLARFSRELTYKTHCEHLSSALRPLETVLLQSTWSPERETPVASPSAFACIP